MNNESIGNLKLYNGDSLSDEALSLLPAGQVDMVLSDPPFGIADHSKVIKMHGKIYTTKEAWGEKFKDKFTKEEYKELITKFAKLAFTALRPGGAFVSFINRKYSGTFAEICEENGFIYKNTITFVKMNCVPLVRAFNYASATEVAVWLVKPQITGGKKAKTKPEVFNYRRPTKNLRHPDNKLDVVEYHNTYSSNVFFYSIGNKIFGHPTEKYGGQIIPLIETHSNKGGLILDPFGGSFAIGYYAEQLGRQYIGFEISQDFFDSSVTKLKEFYAPQSQETEKGTGETGKGTGSEPTTEPTVAA